jgi:hypothetical protein
MNYTNVYKNCKKPLRLSLNLQATIRLHPPLLQNLSLPLFLHQLHRFFQRLHFQPLLLVLKRSFNALFLHRVQILHKLHYYSNKCSKQLSLLQWH